MYFACYTGGVVQREAFIWRIPPSTSLLLIGAISSRVEDAVTVLTARSSAPSVFRRGTSTQSEHIIR